MSASWQKGSDGLDPPNRKINRAEMQMRVYLQGSPGPWHLRPRNPEQYHWDEDPCGASAQPFAKALRQ